MSTERAERQAKKGTKGPSKGREFRKLSMEYGSGQFI